MLTDEQLVARAQEGDPLAKTALAVRYEGAVAAGTSGLFDWTAERADLLQEGRIGLLKAIRDYRPECGPFATFAFLCIRRQAITAVKVSTRQKHDVVSYATRVAVNDDGDELSATEAVEDRLADTPMLAEQRAALATVVETVRERLSPLEREVLIGIAGGESQLALQTRLGYPCLRWDDGRPRPKVVENALQRARAKIRWALEDAA